MLFRTIKMSFWVFFDHLGKLLLANLLSAFLVFAPLLLAQAALSTGFPVISFGIGISLILFSLFVGLPLAQSGLIALVKELIDKHDGDLWLFFRGMRKFMLRVATVNMVYGFLVICLVSSVVFYGYRLGSGHPFLGYGLSALALWTLIFSVLSALFVAPAVIYKDADIFSAIKLALKLVVDNPLFCAGLLLNMLILGAACIMPPVLLCFSFAPAAVLQCSAYEILSRKYKYLNSRDKEEKNHSLLRQIDFGDEDDEYLCRGIRDLLFPWKG
jgi:hypothetical protein